MEIGSGTGANTEYYSEKISRLVLTESDRNMFGRLKSKVSDSGDGGIETYQYPSEELEFPDDTFDAVVSTLVLCSVRDQSESLKEIKRVLRPGGRFYFIEHVLATERPSLIKWQKLLQPLWGCMCGNCHLTRNSERNIIDAGFSLMEIDRGFSKGGPAVISPTIRGIALKSDPM